MAILSHVVYTTDMPTPKKKFRIPYWNIISPFATIGFIFGTSALVIMYGRGYRLRPTGDKLVNATGLLSTTSDPTGAQVFIDGKLTGATASSPSVDPGNHTIRIAKDGYLSWQKDVHIEKEVVSRADAFLFPINPSLSPLTNSGIIKPVLSPDGSKVVYLTPAKEENGNLIDGYTMWIYELADRTLGFNRDPRHVADIEASINIDTATIQWSPDSTELLFTTPTFSRLYKTGRTNDMQVVSQTVSSLLDDWQLEETDKRQKQLSAFKQDFINIATSSAKVISFSPDETKVLYEATASATIPSIINPPLIGANSTQEQRVIKPGNIYVYDSKEDKNYFLLEKKEIAPPLTPTPTVRGQKKLPIQDIKEALQPASVYHIYWFPTSRHVILALNKKIDIMEYDRTNWVTVYAGPFEDHFVAPWPGGSRIVVVTNLNPGSSPLSNLYTVNLR